MGGRKKYPAQLPGGYRRTGRLGKGWRLRMEDPGAVVVFNDVTYAPRVEGSVPGQQWREFGVRRGWAALNIVAQTILDLQFPQWRAALRVTTR